MNKGVTLQGTLYIVGTPIGNLDDITIRALDILKNVQMIAAEDTRHTLKLLNHFEIKTPLTSFHEHNKHTKGSKLIDILLDGKDIALVSDAGMPGIQDPGESLIKLCYDNNIIVTTVPGPTALISGLILSGISTKRYVFEGFLPKDKKELNAIMQNLKDETRTIIFYESPHQLLKTLDMLLKQLGDRNIAVVKEITKRYETILRGTITDVYNILQSDVIKGEYVIVVEGKDCMLLKQENITKWNDIEITKHMQIYLDKGLDKKEAMKKVAKDKGVSKREIYDMLLDN